MTTPHADFQERVAVIPRYGLGLSADLYCPDLSELIEALEVRRLPYRYLELFKGTTSAMTEARRKLPGLPLTYHAEGLWVTQPDLGDDPGFEVQLRLAASHLQALDAAWLNHECATKQIAGRSFGTYLPPLFTPDSAAVTAGQVSLVQRRLDALLPPRAPLVLLETPPLTYFGVGTLDVAEFFRRVTAEAACGLVLDIGHLWTIHRYTAAQQQPLAAFLASFLNRFPLERVVQIHVAGLGAHPLASAPEEAADGPWWLDGHDQPIPPVLFGMLEQVLQDPRLCNLRGIALEVDNKPVAVTVDEFAYAMERFEPLIQRRMSGEEIRRRAGSPPPPTLPPVALEWHQSVPRLRADYHRYLELLLGRGQPEGFDLARMGPLKGLDRYRRQYLRHEILEWGGRLHDMFPETCRAVAEAGVALGPFVEFWFRDAQERADGYDFFLLKVERFVAYVAESCPDLAPLAEREAQGLREGYDLACR